MKHSVEAQAFAPEQPVVPVFAEYLSDEFLAQQEHPIFVQLKLLRQFYLDRPVLLKHNSEVGNSIELLVEEILELNGHAEDGMSLEDYRAQECIDIFNYALTTMVALKHVPDIARIDDIIDSIGIPPVEKSSQVPSKGYPENYERIKRGMVSASRNFYSDEMQTLVSPQEIARNAERLWAYTVAALRALGRNEIEEFREKVAKNMVKYLADAAARDLSEGAYDRYTLAHKKRFKEEGKRGNGGNQYFYYRPENFPSLVTDRERRPESEALTMMTALASLGMTPVEYSNVPTQEQGMGTPWVASGEPNVIVSPEQGRVEGTKKLVRPRRDSLTSEKTARKAARASLR